MNKTCAGCIHYDACLDMYDGSKESFDEFNSVPYCTDMGLFKDKSRFIELPCAVGDTLWVVWSYTEACPKGVYPVKAYALRYDEKKNNMRVCVRGEFKMDRYDGFYYHSYRGTFAWENVGKTVFLTREDAEKALKGGAE